MHCRRLCHAGDAHLVPRAVVQFFFPSRFSRKRNTAPTLAVAASRLASVPRRTESPKKKTTKSEKHFDSNHGSMAAERSRLGLLADDFHARGVLPGQPAAQADAAPADRQPGLPAKVE